MLVFRIAASECGRDKKYFFHGWTQISADFICIIPSGPTFGSSRQHSIIVMVGRVPAISTGTSASERLDSKPIAVVGGDGRAKPGHDGENSNTIGQRFSRLAQLMVRPAPSCWHLGQAHGQAPAGTDDLPGSGTAPVIPACAGMTGARRSADARDGR